MSPPFHKYHPSIAFVLGCLNPFIGITAENNDSLNAIKALGSNGDHLIFSLLQINDLLKLYLIPVGHVQVVLFRHGKEISLLISTQTTGLKQPSINLLQQRPYARLANMNGVGLCGFTSFVTQR
jgi:hypothetical protein